MAKRENGTGSIYQRDNGTWVGVIRGLDGNGKKKAKYFSGKTEAEVKKKIREYNKSSNKIESTKISVEKYIDNWLRLYKLPSLKKSSFDRIENTVKYQINPYIGSLHLTEISSDEIQSLLNKLMKEGYSYSSIKKTYDCLGEVMSFATEKDDILKNPMLLVKMPKSELFEEKEIKYFTQVESMKISEECSRVYKTGKNVYPYGHAFILMLHTGMRMGEVIALKKCDWDKDKNVIRIRRCAKNTKKRDENGNAIGGVEITVDTTKTYSGSRDIPLNDSAKEALMQLCNNHIESEYIVCTNYGGIVPPERFERSFYRMLKNIGLERTGTHSLRHTFASMLFSRGIDVKTVSKLMGHANPEITLKTYIHMTENADANAVAKLDNVY